ncbi:transporter [Cellulomonas chitinilytica]|uniref:Transporter n=1 Tax=Cellulomonas chitinilytica TaxID=398759 RepID=A0A919NYB9_9CELL|nr:ABC transporter permease subunit [Cellulomonas chitinilytica]GIG19767.1 transporter [Cellulomonas chitinilytica]
MTWVTWRQFRTSAALGVAVALVVALALALGWQQVSSLYTSSGLASCSTSCADATAAFLRSAKAGLPGLAWMLGVGAMYLLPGLLGAFWGAPLVGRELEAGTYRLAWTQSITRRRWLAVKLALVGASSVSLAGLLSLVVTTAAARVDTANANRLTPLVFGARGVVPLGYAALAFAVGVASGLLLRRTVPAIAATLGVMAVVQAVVPLFVRAHLIPPLVRSTALDTEHIQEFFVNQDGEVTIVMDPQLSGAWILHNEAQTAAGAVFTGPADSTVCGPGTTPGGCVEWIGTLDLRSVVTYQPASRFWDLQLLETGLLLVLAGLVLGWCFWKVRRLV